MVWHAVRLAALSLSNLSVYPADDIALMNGARTVFASDATGRAAARAQQDYRRGLLASHTDGTGSPPRRIRPPMGARLCDEILFGSHIARHGADIGGGAPSGTQRRGLMAPSFFMLVPTCLMGTIAQTTLTPVLPLLKQQFFGTGHEAASVSGWTDSVGYCMGFVVAGVIGRLSDCYGRRSLIIAQKASSLLCLAALAFRAQLHNNLWIYIGLGVASNAVTGGRYGGSTVWNAYLADCYETHERSLYFGYYQGLTMFSLTIGPLLPVYIPLLSRWDTNFKFAFWLGTADLLYCVCLLPESLELAHRPVFSLGALNPFGPLRYLAESKLVRRLSIVLVPNTLQGAGMGDYLFFYLQTYLGFGTDQNAWLVTCWGITGVMVNWVFLKPLLERFGEQPLICLGLSTALTSQMMFISFTSHFMIIVVQNAVSGFNVLLTVCVSGLISKYTPMHEQGLALGTLAAVQSIVSVLGPAIFGGLYGWAAPKGGLIIGPHISFEVSAVLTLMSLLAAIFYLFPVVAEYEKESQRQQSESRGVVGQTKRVDNPAIENYRRNNQFDYRRGGVPG